MHPRIVREIKNALSVSDSVEVRTDPSNKARLVLIAWRTEHVDWTGAPGDLLARRTSDRLALSRITYRRRAMIGDTRSAISARFSRT